MNENSGMVHPGPRASWWTRPPVLLLVAVGTLIAVLAILSVADMVRRQSAEPPPGNESAMRAPDTGEQRVSSNPVSSTTPSPASSPLRTRTNPTRITSSSSSITVTTTSLTTSPSGTTAMPATETGTDPSTAVETTSTSARTTPPGTTPPGTTPTPRATLTAPTLGSSTLTAPAGGTFAAVFTVTNTSRIPSGPRSVTVATPTGITIADVGIALGPARSGVRAGGHALLPAGSPAHRAASAEINCVGATCTYTVPARMTITVTLTFSVAATARGGTLTLRAAGFAPASATITIAQPAAPPHTPTSRPDPSTEAAATSGRTTATTDPTS